MLIIHAMNRSSASTEQQIKPAPELLSSQMVSQSKHRSRPALYVLETSSPSIHFLSSPAPPCQPILYTRLFVPYCYKVRKYIQWQNTHVSQRRGRHSEHTEMHRVKRLRSWQCKSRSDVHRESADTGHKLVCQLPQGNGKHQPQTTRDPRRDTRPEVVEQGEMLA
jgi:hypothetical protein